jgi:hypothetical protein
MARKSKPATRPAGTRSVPQHAAPRRPAPASAAATAGVDQQQLEAALRAILLGATAPPARPAQDATVPAPPAPAAEAPAGLARKDRPRLPLAPEARHVLTPFGWILVTDAAALLARLYFDTPGPGGQAAGAAALTLAVTALARTLLRLRRRREKKQARKGARRRLPLTIEERRARRRAAWAWALATAWAQVLLWVTPAGPYGAVQVTLILGGLALGSGHLFRHRQRLQPAGIRRAIEAAAGAPATDDADPGPAEPEAAEAPDPRREVFLRRFVTGSGAGSKAQPPLHHAEVSAFTGVEGGFSFEVTADPETSVKFDTVAALRADIASLYDVPKSQVLIDGATSKASERRARVLVLTLNGMFAAPERWNGISSYDPATGAFASGRFGDGTAGHWRLHAPGSGMWGGAVYGAQGTGKSGDLHGIAAQAGIVMRCPACGAYREDDGTCDDCQPSRQFLLFLGDPQKRAFGVWEGCADLLFWGQDACVFQQRLLVEVLTERDADAGSESWTDAKGRRRRGRGWFDPSPAVPGILGITDEWPRVVGAAYGKEAVADSEIVNTTGRKSGVAEIIAAQLPDAPYTGEGRGNRELLKAFNTVAHRLDGTGRSMTSVKGNAADLPEGMHGVGYIAGVDDRSAAPYRTLEFPEDAADGVDVLDMAEIIRDLPVTFDPAVQRVLDRYGLTRGAVITDAWVAELREREERQATQGSGKGATAARPAGSQRPAAVPGAGPVSAGALESVAAALADHAATYGQAAELYDVMAATGLAAGPAGRALAALAADGRASQAGPGTWAPATRAEA